MKAITLREPWATLVAIEAKKIETRSWKAPDWLIGQRIAIHAAKGFASDEQLICYRNPAIREELERSPWAVLLPYVRDCFWQTRGKVIATAVLSGCMRFNEINRAMIDRDELTFGDFTPGRYGWLLRDVQRLPEPIPARGELGVWTWQEPDGLVAA